MEQQQAVHDLLETTLARNSSVANAQGSIRLVQCLLCSFTLCSATNILLPTILRFLVYRIQRSVNGRQECQTANSRKQKGL
jgi:hypothetical protein